MHRATGRTIEISELHGFAGLTVLVRLDNASELVGTLRTDLLSERSISVFLAQDGGEGATIYIDEIVAICRIS
jgi:hypothetical protein